MRILHALFGNPEDLARRETLTRAAFALTASWLRCGEAMLRRLLVIEAAALPAPHLPERIFRHRSERRERARRARLFSPDAPQDWRVSFRCFPVRGARGDGPKREAKAAARDMLSAWPLAERYEALLRAFNAPAPYAQRIARALHRAPRRLARALAAPPEARLRIDRFDAMGEAAVLGFDCVLDST